MRSGSKNDPVFLNGAQYFVFQAIPLSVDLCLFGFNRVKSQVIWYNINIDMRSISRLNVVLIQGIYYLFDENLKATFFSLCISH